MTETIPAKLKK